MVEFVQIEKTVLDDILDRVSFLRKTVTSLYERVRNKEPDDWLTMEQICDLLQISDSKVRSLKRGGHIGFTKCGKCYLYLAKDAAGLLERVNKRVTNG